MSQESQALSNMTARKAPRDRPIVVLLLAALLCFAMWFFVDRVWADQDAAHFSDLYPRWYGARELLLRHRDPYSAAVTREIQIWLHGHSLEGSPQGPQDGDHFAYPLYLAFLLAPTVGLSFATVSNIFQIVLPLAVCATALLWISALRWQISWPLRGALTLLMLASFPAMQCIYLQQPALFAALFLAGSAAALSSRHLNTAGILLALATIKPQLSVLFVLWLILWALSDLRSRMHFLRSFAIAMAVLVGGSLLILPGWIREFWEGLVSYQRYTGNESFLALWLAHRWAIVVTAALLFAVLLICWKFRSQAPEYSGFICASCLVLTTNVVIIPTMYPTTQIVLAPAIFLLLQESSGVSSRAQKLSSFGVYCLLGWPWLGALVYMLLSLVVSLAKLKSAWFVPLCTLLVVPTMVLVALAVRTHSILKVERTASTKGTERSAAVAHD